MKAFAKSLVCAALLSLASGVARAEDDGFAPPPSVPTQRVASAELPATQAANTPRAWAPPPDTRYSTQNSPAQQPVAPPAAAQQSRYASQNSPSQPVLSQPAAQPRYSSQNPSSQPLFSEPPAAAPPPAPETAYAVQPPRALQPTASPPAPAAPSIQPPAAPAPRYSTQSAPPDLAPSRNANPGYHLGAGDKIRLIVYGEDDLGGAFDVDGSGVVRLPLIGQVQAAGLTVHDFELQVASRLADGYLRNPRVAAEVTNYRPFYIIGEVNKPGEYPYVNGMNIVTAVALAGGYTYRASDDDVHVRRNGSQKEEELPANERTIIYPGDIIRISERFF